MAIGLSWANAYATVQQALSAASSGDKIWVAQGTYYPTASTDRSISFVMKNGVALYGGFAATGTPTMGDRDWEAYTSTLSGDIGTPNNSLDNSYHVIYNNNNGLDASAVLDGFTVSGGNAKDNGGTLENASGGGLYNSSSSPTISNSTFFRNSANNGGGLYNSPFSSPTISHSTFSRNNAYAGGGLYNSLLSSPNDHQLYFLGFWFK